MARFEALYKDKIRADLKDKLGCSSVMAVPKITKITVNMGVGEAVADKKVMDFAVADMEKITGQKPLVTKARKSVAGFKIRDGWPIGCKVTLRGKMMYEFLERLVTIAIPRIRDFRGYSARGFDGQGNYNLGIKEQIVFPELNLDEVKRTQGMHITFVTTAQSDSEGVALLLGLGLPFKSLGQ